MIDHRVQASLLGREGKSSREEGSKMWVGGTGKGTGVLVSGSNLES